MFYSAEYSPFYQCMTYVLRRRIDEALVYKLRYALWTWHFFLLKYTHTRTHSQISITIHILYYTYTVCIHVYVYTSMNTSYKSWKLNSIYILILYSIRVTHGWMILSRLGVQKIIRDDDWFSKCAACGGKN